MKLSYLITGCVPLWERILSTDNDTDIDPEINSIHSDSRDVKPGGLFIALKGFKTNGQNYIDAAFAKGAAAVISEKRIQGNPRVIQVKDSRKAMAMIAARFYGNPSEKICLTGITGTNGKTTTAWILESILNAAKISSGVIGTVNMRYGGKTYPAPVTTPQSIDLQKMLFKMKNAGVTHVIMEVSSHGIDLNRISGCSFDIGVFTNLSQDHLDYHKTMARYFACKKRFFTKILAKGSKASTVKAVINLDSEWGKKIADALKIKTITTSADPEAKACITCLNISEGIDGMRGEILIAGRNFAFKSGLTGHFNLENILSAAGSAYGLGIAPEIIIQGIEQCTSVPGRLERIENSINRFIFVDFAHTPDALENILKVLKERSPARLICVFGCGGDRDRKKRPLMGKIAVKYSDFAIVTSDNPRSEDPGSIIKDILTGIEDSETAMQDSVMATENSEINIQNSEIVEYNAENIKAGFKEKGFFVESDRKTAIETALMVSRENDIIVVAGKGHETYQILKTGTIDFDDRKILKNALIDYNGHGIDQN